MKQYLNDSLCECGKMHRVDIDEILIGKGVVNKLPELVKKYGANNLLFWQIKTLLLLQVIWFVKF